MSFVFSNLKKKNMLLFVLIFVCILLNTDECKSQVSKIGLQQCRLHLFDNTDGDFLCLAERFFSNAKKTHSSEVHNFTDENAILFSCQSKHYSYKEVKLRLMRVCQSMDSPIFDFIWRDGVDCEDAIQKTNKRLLRSAIRCLRFITEIDLDNKNHDDLFDLMKSWHNLILLIEVLDSASQVSQFNFIADFVRTSKPVLACLADDQEKRNIHLFLNNMKDRLESGLKIRIFHEREATGQRICANIDSQNTASFDQDFALLCHYNKILDAKSDFFDINISQGYESKEFGAFLEKYGTASIGHEKFSNINSSERELVLIKMLRYNVWHLSKEIDFILHSPCVPVQRLTDAPKMEDETPKPEQK